MQSKALQPSRQTRCVSADTLHGKLNVHLESGVSNNADSNREVSSFATWAGRVAELCDVVSRLKPLAADLGLPSPTDADWYGALLGKLRPQVSREPVLVAAVCGGTNTGKSLITNTLVGAEISRSLPEAARTIHPVASLPQGLVARGGLDGLFPGFDLVAWTSEEDALDASRGDVLVWREDPTGQQPARLVILDTPDIDGTLRENWRRAELVRDAADVLVAVLTQQKYNDAAVRDFFTAAAAADKTVIVVFNMVDWPRQRERLGGWLATFVAETGVKPLAVYSAPHDFAAAEAGRMTLHAVPELGADARDRSLAERLATSDFDSIKSRAMVGALRVVLDLRHGISHWLESLVGRSAEWQKSLAVLEQEGQVRVELPAAPREIVWQEIWDWLEPRRSGFDLAVSRVYRGIGSGIGWTARRLGLARSDIEKRDDFSAIEIGALKVALGDFIERLEDACRRDPKLESLLGPRLASSDRSGWYADLERRHAMLPLVSDDYRRFVRDELDRFASDNPSLVKVIVNGLNVGAVARPVVTLSLLGAGAAAVPAAAGAAGGLSVLVHHVGDYVVWAAAPLVGEGALGLAVAGVRPLIERLFAGWSAERSRILVATLRDVVLGTAVEELERRAAAAQSPDLSRGLTLVAECRRELPVS
jgi:hypothetical protein